MRRPISLNIQKALNFALQKFNEGQVKTAGKALRQILSGDPMNADANHLLGVIALQAGKLDTANKFISKAIRANPNLAFAHNNLGELYRAKALYEDAAACYRTALGLDPKLAGAHNNLGIVLQELDRAEDAEKSYNKALSIDPDFAIAHVNLGSVLHETGRPEKAIACYRAALGIRPNLPGVRNKLGLSLLVIGKTDEAIACFRKALSIDPKDIPVLTNLGNTLQAHGNLDEAITCYRKILAIDANSAVAYNNLGNALQELGQMDEAIASYNKAIAIAPSNSMAHTRLGNAFQAIGEIDRAQTSYRTALGNAPDNADAHFALSNAKRHDEHDEEIHAMEDLYQQQNLSDQQKLLLGFALGKAFEELKEFETAFAYFTDANQLKRQAYEYSTIDSREFFERIKNTFSPEFLPSTSQPGTMDQTSIFFVGMPRSGTTLAEQILASHPLVFGAGELDYLPKIIDESSSEHGNLNFPESVRKLDAGELDRIGADYIDATNSRSGSSKFVVDKMPHNFLRIGLIRKILPGAKIILCRRSPIENCWSIFKTHFSRGHRYAYDLSEIADYYKLHADLMEYWIDTIPGYMHIVDYEDLLDNQEDVTRGILEHCDLDWDPSCLRFFESARTVYTASSAQVRRPLYRDSIQLSSLYGEKLIPLRQALQQGGGA